MNNIEDKLLSAITDNDIKQVRFLLEAGANPNYISCFDETPLIYACRHSNIKTKIIEMLLNHGANPSHLEFNGFSPLLLAVTRQNLKVVDKLITAGADINVSLQGKNIIWYSMQSNNPDMLKYILERTGIDIDKKDNQTGYTSLDWSLFHHMDNYTDSLKTLGANSNKI